jgi:hypothetical protein
MELGAVRPVTILTMAADEPVTRRELDLLKAEADRKHAEQDVRLQALDQGASRGVIVLQVQIQDLTKEVTKLRADMDHRFDAHAQQHDRDEAKRVTSRRWLVGSIIAAIAAIDGPIVTVVLARR